MRNEGDVRCLFKYGSQVWFKTKAQSRFELLLVFFIEMASRTLLFR